MDTLLIQLNNAGAYKLLKDMQELKLIEILKDPVKISLLRKKIKTRMSNEQIDQQINSIRGEWQRAI